VSLSGAINDRLSILPLGKDVELTYSGLKYPLNKATAFFGSTRTLRNVFAQKQASITIKGGAIVVHHFDYHKGFA
jgi:thiamine pyrophosphokinase